MRRLIAILALALCVLGCGGEVKLLTGGSGHLCGWAGPGPWVAGPLVPDPANGTAITVERSGTGFPYLMPAVGTTVPVMWPKAYTGQRLPGGEVEVRDGEGNVVATTGRRYTLAPPVPTGDNLPRAENGPWPACGAGELTEAEVAALPTPPIPSYDLAAVKADLHAECTNASLLSARTCEQIDVEGMRGVGVELTVRASEMHRDLERAQVVCEEIASAHLDLDGAPLGYEIVIIEGVNNRRLAECSVDG